MYIWRAPKNQQVDTSQKSFVNYSYLFKSLRQESQEKSRLQK